MNRLSILALAAVLGAVGITSPREPTPFFVDPPVNLQPQTPGGTQSGHAHISGTMIVGKLIAQSAAAADRTVSATATSATGATYGGYFRSQSSAGTGVYGEATSVTGSTAGGRFVVASSTGKAVHGLANATIGRTYGGYFESKSSSGAGVFGYASASTGNTTAGQFQSNSENGIAVAGYADTKSNGTNFGGYFVASDFSGGTGVFAKSGFLGIRGNATDAAGTGIWGTGGAIGVKGTGATGGYFQALDGGTGVYAKGKNGVEGESESATDSGVWGHNLKGYGVSGSTTSTEASGTAGVWGHNNGSGIGVKGSSTGTGFAGFFAGRLGVQSGNELFFNDGGQIRSFDDKHRILFRRNENKMEFREFGDIVFSPGATAGAETGKVVMTGDGYVGINKAQPTAPLHMVGNFFQEAGEMLFQPSGVFKAIEDFRFSNMSQSIGAPPTLIMKGDGRVGIGVENPGQSANLNKALFEVFTPSGMDSPQVAVHGNSPNSGPLGGGIGVYGTAGWMGGKFEGGEIGVKGISDGTTPGMQFMGVLGIQSNDNGFAVYANGNLGAAGFKPFRIDHPNDPANKYLLHYSSESPEPLNLYRGTIVTDENGFAWAQLPDYYEAINKNPSYQLTVVDEGEDFVLAKVSKRISGGKFQIRTNKPGVEVCWEVKAVRNDMWARKHPAEVEVAKPDSEKGTYQQPALFGKSADLGTFSRDGVQRKKKSEPVQPVRSR